MNTPDSLPNNYLPLPKVYLQRHPNQPIQLYKGFLEIIQGTQVIEGNGIVAFVWFPRPCVTFEFTHFTSGKVSCGEISLKLTEIGVSVPAYVSHYQGLGGGTGKQVVSGHPCKPVVIGSDQNLSSLLFHLSNFPFFNISNLWEEGENIEFWLPGQFDGQFVFQHGDWRVAMATLPSAWDIQEALQSKGGYGFTHVCKLERVDRSTFPANDARDCLDAFSHYLSFARGIWTVPMLLAGFDSTGNIVWEEWAEYQASSWQENYSWFSPDCLNVVEAFPGFMRRWQDRTWHDLVKKSIRWYVDSNSQDGGADGAIVLEQAALELLAWSLLAGETLSHDSFQRLSAADRIRRLLSHFEIPLVIPKHMTSLTALATRRNWIDGPQAFTAIRNAIVHPPRSPQRALLDSPLIINEAWNLGLQYLELVLLRFFDYPYAYPYDLDDV